MTDLEMTKLCAEAIGVEWCAVPLDGTSGLACYLDPSMKSKALQARIYDPLHNDAQAMALVKKLRLHINSFHGAALLEKERWWEVEHNDGKQATIAKHADLNRAIVECVAKRDDPHA
jgi:hypothetical protein